MDQLPQSCLEARLLGKPHYFTGKLCRHGHRAARDAKRGECCECLDIRAATARAYRSRHRDAVRERERLRGCLPHRRELSKRIYRRIREEDPERIRVRERKYRTENYEKLLIYIRGWRDRNRDRVNSYAQTHRALKLGAEGRFTAEDVAKIREQQKDKCAVCRKRLSGRGEVDHIISLAAGGTNWPNNLQLLCRSCNGSKNSRDPIEFMQSVGRLL